MNPDINIGADRPSFQEFIREQLKTYTLSELAELSRSNPGTIARWAANKSAPGKKNRLAIVERIRNGDNNKIKLATKEVIEARIKKAQEEYNKKENKPILIPTGYRLAQPDEVSILKLQRHSHRDALGRTEYTETRLCNPFKIIKEQDPNFGKLYLVPERN